MKSTIKYYRGICSGLHSHLYFMGGIFTERGIDFMTAEEYRACDTFEGESLVLIKTDNHDDFQTYFQQHLDELYAQIDAGNVGDGYTKEMAYDDLFHGIIESIVYPRDKVYSDKSLYNEALEEAERRKSENMKKLYSYQILKS